MALRATTEPRLRSFQYKIFFNIYPHNALLYKMKMVPSSRCNLCNEIEFIEHKFFTCPGIQPFWNYVKKIIDFIAGKTISLDIPSALFGFTKNSNIGGISTLNQINLVILLAKFSIIKTNFQQQLDLKHSLDLEISLRRKKFPSLITH